MKIAPLLLSVSVAANLALVVLYVRHPAPPEIPVAAHLNRSTTSSSADAVRAALASGDAAALQAAGISPDVARDLRLGRAFSKIADRIRAARAKNATDDRWWRVRSGTGGSREQQLLARRELSDALVATFGDDLGVGGGDSSQFAFLEPAKRDALRRIIQDYDEMIAKFSPGGVQLASDKEKLRLLRAERDRDIAALLTPDERLAYEMRTSPTSAMVRGRYGDAIESEVEFQKIYALQKAFDEKYPREALNGRVSPEVLRARGDAERQLDNDVRAAVGEDRYAALRRARDSDVRTLDSLVARLNLPPTTTDTIMSTRESYAADSQRINGDSSVSLPQRRAQIQELAARAKSELSRTLGAEAADAYAQASPWVSMLQSGMAYSTTPRTDSPGGLFNSGSVYPVMPAGTGGLGAPRQVIFNATADGPASDAIIGGGGGSGQNVRVMTFSTSGTETDAGASQGVTKSVITVPPGGQATTTPKPAP